MMSELVRLSPPAPTGNFFQASDWPTWLYGLDYITFGILLTVFRSMLLCLHGQI